MPNLTLSYSTSHICDKLPPPFMIGYDSTWPTWRLQLIDDEGFEILRVLIFYCPFCGEDLEKS